TRSSTATTWPPSPSATRHSGRSRSLPAASGTDHMKKFVALSIALALAAPALHAQEPVSFMSVRECGRMGFAFLADAPLRVAAVLPGAPADRAGLRPNDVVVRIDGDEASPERIKLIADTLMPGDTVRLRVRRGGDERDLTIVAARDVCVRSTAPDMLRTRMIFDSIR